LLTSFESKITLCRNGKGINKIKKWDSVFHWSRFHKITEKQNNNPHLTINRRDSLFSSKKNRKFAIQQLLSCQNINKGTDMPESPIRKLVPILKLQRKKGIKYITWISDNLTLRHLRWPWMQLEFWCKSIRIQPFIPVLKAIDQIISILHKSRITHQCWRYYYYNRWIRSFFFAMGSTMDPGDEIIIQNHFTQITMVFCCIWVNVVSVISSIDTGFALPAIADFENYYAKNKSNLICNPGNPTGYLYSKKKWCSLLN
jgi:aspartate aminotransferase